jgi:hypothetical protein
MLSTLSVSGEGHCVRSKTYGDDFVSDNKYALTPTKCRRERDRITAEIDKQYRVQSNEIAYLTSTTSGFPIGTM